MKQNSKYFFLTKNIVPTVRGKISGGKGAVFYFSGGREILDFSSQTLNLSLGHNYPALIDAAKRQLDVLSYHSSRFASDVFMTLAQRLIDLTDEHLNKINLKLTDGSDAVESAIKRARVATGRRYIVAFRESHHGETVETIACSGKHFNGLCLGSSRDYFWLDPDESCVDEFANLLRSNREVAGLIVEPIMVNAGVIVQPAGRLSKLRKLCSEFGVALIFDEIQTAFGWLGPMFAYEKVGVIPDMIALGKALAPGFPLAAVILNEKYDVLDYGYDELTYGGNPISCAVALANLDILKKVDFNFDRKSGLLKERLKKYQASGDGLIWGVPCANREQARASYRLCLEKDLLLRLSGDEKTLIFKPPLVVTEAEINRAMDIFDSIWIKKY